MAGQGPGWRGDGHACEVLAHKEELPEGWDPNPTNTSQ